MALRRAFGLAETLVRRGETSLAIDVADIALERVTGQDAVLNLRFVRCLARIESGGPFQGYEEVVDSLLARADELFAQAQGSRDHSSARAAARWFALSLRIFLHRRLHTSLDTSPLAFDPAEAMVPFRASTIYQALQPLSVARDSGGLRATQVPPRTVAVLTSEDSFFLRPVIEAAHALSAEVRQLRLADVDPAWSGMSALLGDRVVGLVDPVVDPLVVPGVLVGVDVVFVDWADEAAAWASVRLPVSGPRLVVRLHSVEALSAAVHVVDWSRVDRLVFVSEFLRRLTHAVVPATRSVDSVVVGHGVVSAGVGVKSAGAWSTLGMVGWGQVVKDPLFAVEVLALLRARDPQRDWRLRLIGGSLESGARPWDAGYIDDLQRIVGEPLVAGAIEMTGFTDNVNAALEDVGFILSTSLREADPHGVVEGVLSGAVPVVRDWPVVAPWGGARELFPADWIVQTPEEAADRILSVNNPEIVGREAAEWIVSQRPYRDEQVALMAAMS